MQDNRVQQATTAAEYQAAFRLSSTVLEVSAIPERYRWSDDRIRTDLIARDQRRAQAVWLQSICRWTWKRVTASLSHPGKQSNRAGRSIGSTTARPCG